MTDPHAIDRAHHVEERLGIMIGAADPTPEQLAAAQAEAQRAHPMPARPVLATPQTLFQPRKP